MDKKFLKNIEILEENDVKVCNTEPVWADKPNSVELEYYTNAGGDMIICLDEPSRKCLNEYLDDFDIDEEVTLWWQNGREAAHAKGVPFDNIREHYEDLEEWKADLRNIAIKLD